MAGSTFGEGVSREESDRYWMRRALAEAERGRGRVEPNPLVGASITRDGRLIALGRHDRFGGPHAEIVALEHAGEAARGATLHVTLEPCSHHGKTPPCVDAIIAAGITRVSAAMLDPFPQVAGRGFERLREVGIEVEMTPGDEVLAARRLNAAYLKRLATGMPYVIAKWAMTLDGKTAVAGGDSRWISNARSRAAVHETRGRVDAIAVGIGTVLADNPELTARPSGPRTAVRLVLDGAARLPVDSRLALTARETPVWIAVDDRAPIDRIARLERLGCRIELFKGPGPVQIGPLLALLGREGMSNVLVEGGGRVSGAFFDADQVDEVDVFIAPAIEGGSHDFGPIRGLGVDLMNRARRFERTEVSVIDGDVRFQGRFARFWLLDPQSRSAADGG